MRPLRDYFIDGGSLDAFQTIGAISALREPIPDEGRLIECVINLYAGPTDAPTTFDVLVNGVDSLIDVTLPILAQDLGYTMRVPSTGIQVFPGDLIRLQSNGETALTPSMTIMHVVRR